MLAFLWALAAFALSGLCFLTAAVIVAWRAPGSWGGEFTLRRKLIAVTSLGAGADGGAYDYMAGDSMIGGCALIAYPARHGVSGVMTFMVNHDGVVFEKDLGERTAEAAASIGSFDPRNWKKVSP